MFPLFRLDRVSRDEVLLNLSPLELFKLALCSKKSFQIVKPTIKKTNNHYNASISALKVMEAYNICKDNDENWWEYRILKIQDMELQQRTNSFEGHINGTPVTVCIEGNTINTYWTDEILGFKLMNDLFDIDVAFMVFHSKYFESPSEILDSITNRKSKLEFARIDLDSIDNDGELKTILDKLRLSRTIHIMRMKAGDEFIANDIRVYNHQRMIIDEGYWVTLPRLLTMNCKRIYLYETKLTNTEVNTFLKEWINGSCSQLEYLVLGLGNADVPTILKDTQYVRNEERVVKSSDVNAQSVTVAHDIRRFDRVPATVFVAMISETKYELEMQVLG